LVVVKIRELAEGTSIALYNNKKDSSWHSNNGQALYQLFTGRGFWMWKEYRRNWRTRKDELHICTRSRKAAILLLNAIVS